MFEARLVEGIILKNLVQSIKDMVEDANFDCCSTGITLQAMDSSHVSLVALFLRAEGFQHFRADRTISLGVNLASMAKILKCAGDGDSISIKSHDDGDHVNLVLEGAKHTHVSEFSLRLMDIDSEQLGIPDTVYQCVVQMPAAEFQRICTEMSVFGDTVKISASKEGVRFQVAGDLGAGDIVCKSNPCVDDEDEAVSVECEEEVSLTFALRYLTFFAKAARLSKKVGLNLLLFKWSSGSMIFGK